MATATENVDTTGGETILHNKDTNGTSGVDHAAGVAKERKPFEYGGNPLAHIRTNDASLTQPAFGGDFQPGLYRAPSRKIANPAPLGLSAFALTTFVLSLINLDARGVSEPNLVLAIAFGYGGLVQLLAGMWEFPCGNTFGATALSSYGGFWISFAVTLTPAFGIIDALGPKFYDAFGFFLMGWFIFTFILLICTLRSTLAFFMLFFSLDLAFLMLGIGWLKNDGGKAPNTTLVKAGGGFGVIAALLAWYNALAGIADNTNSFFVIPVLHFPWSEKGREARAKVNNDAARAEQAV